MFQLFRRIVAAGLLTGGMVGCASVPGVMLGHSGAANASIRPAVHWSFSESRTIDAAKLIPVESLPSSDLNQVSVAL